MKTKEIQTQEKIFQQFELYYDYFSIKKIPLYKNKRRITEMLKKKKKRRSFDMWYMLPYALLIYTPKIKFFHLMQNYLYKLKDCLIVRKQRFFYKKNYSEKAITSFFTYRIYCYDFYNLYDCIEEIGEYDINILGIEIHNKLYPIEYLPKALKKIKEDLNFFFNIFNDFNKEFSTIMTNLNKLDTEYQQNIFNFITLCPHIIK